MQRDMMKIINTAKEQKCINSKYDLTIAEASELMEGALPFTAERVYNAVCNAFVFGYVMGTRANQKALNKKE